MISGVFEKIRICFLDIKVYLLLKQMSECSEKYSNIKLVNSTKSVWLQNM